MSGPRSFLVLGSAVLLLLVPAARAFAEWPSDTTTSVPVCTATGQQLYPVSAPDGAGGVIVAWSDARSGNYHVYAQCVNATGAATWATNGVSLSTTTSNQQSPRIVSDGSGGAIVAWLDLRSGLYNLYTQHVLANGTLDPVWPVDGRALGTLSATQTAIVLTTDGAGGAIAAWDEFRHGYTRVYAQRVGADGAVKWTVGGVLAGALSTTQHSGAIAAADSGSAIVAWYDLRSGNYDIYAQRIGSTGSVLWAAVGVPLCVASGSQQSPVAIADGSGGAIVAWVDARLGPNNVYVQRVNGSSVVQWTANGVGLTSFTSEAAASPVLCRDDAGGAIVAWHDPRMGDNDIYAQRVSATGATPWGNGGAAVCIDAGNQQYAALVPDGLGGAVVTWEDWRSGTNSDLYAQRIDAGGQRVWEPYGVPVCAAAGNQSFLTLAPDGSGGAIASWQDARAGASNSDIYAQRISRAGTDSDRPRIVAITDVPWDQGGRTRIRWIASPLDTLPALTIGDYGIWRQVSAEFAARALARGARLARAGERADVRPGILRAEPGAASTTWWEGVGVVPARGDAWYTCVAGTSLDSSAAGFGWTTFMVDARAAFTSGYWASDPDSGYSVDNLTPAAPTPFTGSYAGGVATLHWGAGAEPDLAVYRLHRGASAEFTPGPGNLVVEQPGTAYVDKAEAPCWYKLAAVDLHGNVSAYATLLPSGSAGVEARAPSQFALERVHPNPVARGAFDVEFALARGGSARLELLDVGGRRVAARDVGAKGAGWYSVRLEEGAQLAPGLYVVRLTQDGDERVTRVVVTR